MVDLIKYEALKFLYLKNPKNRTRIFREFFELFGFDDHWVYQKNADYQSRLEMKANFILALDEIINQELPADEIEDAFGKAFSKATRRNIEMNRGLHYSFKHMVKKYRDPATRDMDSDELKYYRVMRSLAGLSIKGCENLYEQEHEIMATHVRDFLVKKYGEQVYYDCISHYVYGEPFEDIAYYDGSGVTRQGMWFRLNKAWKDLRRYLRE